MFVHAHPDDESSQSPATMSRYVDEGAQVTLVTCTLGELGEILVPELEHLSPKELGAHRIGELTQAMETLGVTDHVWLGGQGRYHDSGMATDDQGNVIPRDELPEGAFWAADLLEAADHLVALIRDRRPQVIATYDQNGNYGHPDHIQAHRVTMYASQLAAVPSYRPDLGEPWQVSRILWITYNPMAWAAAFEKAQEVAPEMVEGFDPEAMRRRFNIDPEQIAAVIGFDERAERCEAALAAAAAIPNTETEPPHVRTHLSNRTGQHTAAHAENHRIGQLLAANRPRPLTAGCPHRHHHYPGTPAPYGNRSGGLRQCPAVLFATAAPAAGPRRRPHHQRREHPHPPLPPRRVLLHQSPIARGLCRLRRHR